MFRLRLLLLAVLLLPGIASSETPMNYAVLIITRDRLEVATPCDIGIYLQDQLALGQWRLTVGGRYDWTKDDTWTQAYTVATDRYGARTPSHIETLLGQLAPGAGLVTVLDGSPAALSWLGGVSGHRVSPLGTDRFGQTGDLPDLYRTYRLDSDAIIDAMAELFL